MRKTATLFITAIAVMMMAIPQAEALALKAQLAAGPDRVGVRAALDGFHYGGVMTQTDPTISLLLPGLIGVRLTATWDSTGAATTVNIAYEITGLIDEQGDIDVPYGLYEFDYDSRIPRNRPNVDANSAGNARRHPDLAKDVAIKLLVTDNLMGYAVKFFRFMDYGRLTPNHNRVRFDLGAFILGIVADFRPRQGVNVTYALGDGNGNAIFSGVQFLPTGKYSLTYKKPGQRPTDVDPNVDRP